MDESAEVDFIIIKDGRIVPTYKGQVVFGEGASMPPGFVGKEYTNDEGDNQQNKKPKDGSVAIVYHVDASM